MHTYNTMLCPYVNERNHFGFENKKLNFPAEMSFYKIL